MRATQARLAGVRLVESEWIATIYLVKRPFKGIPVESISEWKH
jgi:hypothetical protein